MLGVKDIFLPLGSANSEQLATPADGVVAGCVLVLSGTSSTSLVSPLSMLGR